MLKIIAFECSDGLAFIDEGGRILFTKPPYEVVEQIGEEFVERAVKGYGFVVCEEIFESFSDIVKFLRQKMVNNQKEEGIPLLDVKLGEELLHYAPINIIELYLRRINAELLPSSRFFEAEQVLTKIISNSPIVARHDILRKRVVDLLEDVQSKQKSNFQQKG